MTAQQTETVGKKDPRVKKDYASIVRLMQTDIPGNKQVLVGLTYIKGVSWSFSHAVCYLTGIDPRTRIKDLSAEQQKMITTFLEQPKNLPVYILNRRKDFETGEDGHLLTTRLDMKKEFDVRRLKKIRSYRGLRHAFGHPSRGQRTRSNFRGRGKAVGVQKRKGAKKK